MRSGLLFGMAVTVGLASGCATSAPTAPHHVAKPAGSDPSTSAKMVCAPEAQHRLADVLGVTTTVPVAPTWVDHRYACTYHYGNGSLTLSVQELENRAQTTAYYELLRAQLGDTGSISGLGQGAFTTTDGSIVARKDYKVLLVDISGLPPQFGVPATSAADVAVTVADLIMGCWTGA